MYEGQRLFCISGTAWKRGCPCCDFILREKEANHRGISHVIKKAGEPKLCLYRNFVRNFGTPAA
jgi:hypothetical protein